MSVNKIIQCQPIINIGCLGSVSDGKSTLVAKLAGIKTQRHSDELKRNITIHQGYGNLKIFEKKDNDEIEYHTTDSTGLHDTSDYKLVSHVSFVDCPGHQDLIQTMLSSIVLMDGAIIVVAVNQPLTLKPQLIQHLAAAKLGKITKIIVCMNKIDLVTKEVLKERKIELDKMLAEYEIKPFAIIPTCFNKKIGLKYVIKAILELFNPNEYLKKASENPIFRISRSFDINKGGTNWDEVLGGVIGGSLFNGKLSINDKIEIRPGQITKEKNGKYICKPIITTIVSIKTDTTDLTEIIPGGLIGIRTDLDPYYCKNNGLSGQIVGKVGTLPEIFTEVILKVTIITSFGFIWSPKVNDIIMLQIGTKMSECKLTKINNEDYTFTLTKPTCITNNQHIIICYNINKILRIVGEGYPII
jgi:translation initiation factor 2 subunit 3